MTVVVAADIAGWWLEGRVFPGSRVLQMAVTTMLWGGQTSALSWQPVVENAVRNGVMKRPEGGAAHIFAEETQYIVTVTDDGVGFDPMVKHDDGRTHIGISNVRMRLRDMCGGDLLLSSRPGAGTTATLALPKNAGCNQANSR